VLDVVDFDVSRHDKMDVPSSGDLIMFAA